VGDPVLVFNGRDGKWLAYISLIDKPRCVLQLAEIVREQPETPDFHYLFAPLRKVRLDYMVQKAVELGVASLRPIVTQHTQVAKVNKKRIVSNVIEAAEQCGILFVPEVRELISMRSLLANWAIEYGDCSLIFCDEMESVGNFYERVSLLKGKSVAVLVGPEGGFSVTEREILHSKDFVIPVSLGSRILRSDTAAVAALALVQLLLFT